MPTNTLTDAECRRAQPGEKPQKLFDGGGLHLYVTPKGAKTWRVAYRIGGKPQTMSLGPYPTVSLADARQRREDLKRTLHAGGDPMAPRRERRQHCTFKEACEQFLAGKKSWSDTYRSNATRALEMHLYPMLGNRQIGALTREDLLEPLNVMDAKGLHQYVRKTRMWAGQVFEWAIEQGHAKVNPATLIKPDKAFGEAKVKHFASVSQGELPALIQRIGLENQSLLSVLACRFMALTWVRTAELRGMVWKELDGDKWRIPAKRMKMERDHIVPLSRQAQAIVATMRARRTVSDYVFPSEHRADRPMSANTVLALLARVGYKHIMTGHGWRSVASTWANEMGYRADAVELQLAHAEDDSVRAAYNHAEWLPQRAKMLQDWADHLDHIDAGGAER